MKRLDGIEDFGQALQSGKTLLVLKHSSTCPISHAAYEEYETFANEHLDVATYYLIVQENRELSNTIAEKYGIKHESPQVLLIQNEEVAWHASHWKITNKALKEAIVQ